jgi:hypothetical protein
MEVDIVSIILRIHVWCSALGCASQVFIHSFFVLIEWTFCFECTHESDIKLYSLYVRELLENE